jgi:uncharacterized lipoprotein YddW (UPF0748 family)
MKRVILLFLAACSVSFAFTQPKPEFRGVWIASVDNIDWPRRNDWNSENQKTEFIRQLDMHQQNGMNAVVVQVRPAADAFYPSPYEPWSQWLTGKQGKPPVPYYDPLQFTIDESHKRGFEYHAWVNPYRANFNISKASIAPAHVTRLHPEWFLEYGGKLYFDPGNKEAQNWVVEVMRDMISRYDIDALHMDDYFYPYRIAGKEFPDTASYRLHGNGMKKDDWRRSNTDSIIYKLTTVIHQTKPWMKFGISPFGVWRNQDKDSLGSPTKAGVTNYDDLYADVLLWLKEGWIDYVAPQIYWEFSHKAAPFQPILEWWNNNANGRHVYVGLGIYRAGSNTAWKDFTQIPRQIDSTRSMPNVQGQVYFSSTTFDKNPFGWNDTLRTNHYREKVMVPDMPWLPKKPTAASQASLNPSGGGAF